MCQPTSEDIKQHLKEEQDYVTLLRTAAEKAISVIHKLLRAGEVPTALINIVVLALVQVEVLLYVHRNRRFIRDGSPGRPPRLTFTQLLTYDGGPRPLRPFSSRRLWFVDTVLRLCPSLPTETLKWLSSLPTLMQESLWW